MPYTTGDGIYHNRRRCRRLRRTGSRVRRIDDTSNLDACDHCVDERDTAELIGAGVCPWCDEYTGDYIGQHASSAHPDAWADWRNE